MKMPSDSRWSWVGKDFKYTYVLFCNSSFKWSTPENQGAGLPYYLKIDTRKSRWVWCRSDTHMCMYTVSFACTCWCEGLHGNQSSLYISKVNSLNTLSLGVIRWGLNSVKESCLLCALFIWPLGLTDFVCI